MSIAIPTDGLRQQRYEEREIPIDQIKVPMPRLRPQRPDNVSELMRSISIIDLQNAIIVNSDLEVISGSNRLKACLLLGHPTIRARVVDTKDKHIAELMQIDENLVRAELTVLEQAQHLHRRNELLIELGIRAQRGDNQHAAGGDAGSPPVTTADIATQMGISERSAQKRQQIARDIAPEAADVIRDMDPLEYELPNSTEDLRRLVRQEPDIQVEAVRRIASRAARDVGQAVAQINAEQRLRPVEIPDDDRWKVLEGDAGQELAKLEAESVDVIMTDPPYPHQYLDLYRVLAEQAARVLKPGGSVLAMAGQSYLPDVFALMCPHLKYHWMLNYDMPGPSPKIWPRCLSSNWKPILWFTKGEYSGPLQTTDVIRSPVEQRVLHKWQQSEGGFRQLVERFSLPGDLVLDPFNGAGTTGVAAVGLGRRFIGIDNDPDAVETSRRRLAHVVANMTAANAGSESAEK